MLEKIVEGGDSDEAFEMDPQEHIQEMLDGFEKGIYIERDICYTQLYIILIVFNFSTYLVFEFHTL